KGPPHQRYRPQPSPVRIVVLHAYGIGFERVDSRQHVHRPADPPRIAAALRDLEQAVALRRATVVEPQHPWSGHASTSLASARDSRARLRGGAISRAYTRVAQPDRAYGSPQTPDQRTWPGQRRRL